MQMLLSCFCTSQCCCARTVQMRFRTRDTQTRQQCSEINISGFRCSLMQIRHRRPAWRDSTETAPTRHSSSGRFALTCALPPHLHMHMLQSTQRETLLPRGACFLTPIGSGREVESKPDTRLSSAWTKKSGVLQDHQQYKLHEEALGCQVSATAYRGGHLHTAGCQPSAGHAAAGLHAGAVPTSRVPTMCHPPNTVLPLNCLAYCTTQYQIMSKPCLRGRPTKPTTDVS